MGFSIDRVPAVVDQMQRLGIRAAQLGIYDEYLSALKSAFLRLETDPLVWGDPEYRTKKEGGLICHGVAPPLVVRFAAYEAEQAVIVLEIKSVGTSPLSE